jgi:hypothetical protein
LARFLGIDWNPGSHGQAPLLCIVEASVHRGKLRVQRALSWPEAPSPDSAGAAEAGRRLRERLKEAGIAPAPVLYAIGRDRVLFREVRYPDVPADEVAAVVHYQAAKELTFSPEEAVIDYTLSSSPGPLGEKRALVAVLRKEPLSAIQQTCQAAGLRLEVVSARPFALLANWQTQTGAGAAGAAEVSGVLVVTHGGGELCVVRGSELLFSRAIAPAVASNGDDPAAAYLPELRRSLAAYSSHFPQQPVSTLYVAGEPVATGIGVLASGLGLKVLPFDPLSGTDAPDLANKEAFAGALGMVQALRAHRRLPIDFLAPKKPRPPVNRKKLYIFAAAALVLILLGGVGAAYGLAVSSRNDQIEELAAKNDSLEKEIKAYGDVDKRAEGLDAWAAQELVILDELYDLIAQFPDQPGIRITKASWTPAAQMAVKPSSSSGQATKAPPRPIGLLTLEASSESAEALERLRRALDGLVHWKLDLWEPDTPRTNQARATLKVYHQAPRDYRTVLGVVVNNGPAPPPAEVRPGPGGKDHPEVRPGPSGKDHPDAPPGDHRPEGGRP